MPKTPQEPAKASSYSPQEELLRLRNLKTDLDARLEQASKAGSKVTREEIRAIKSKQEELSQGLASLQEVADQRDQAKKAKQLQEQLAKTREVGREVGPETLGIPNLKEQYTANQELFAKHKLIEILSTGELGIKAIDGKEYPLPTLEQVKERLEANKDLVEQKTKQGFKKIVVVPFGLPLEKLITTYRRTILEHKAQGRLKGANGDDLDLEQNEPLWVWEAYNRADLPTTKKTEQIIYYPKYFNPDNPQGHTKAELLGQDPQAAFQILLLEETPNIPRQGQGQEVGGRKQLEADQKPQEYLQTIGAPHTPYQGEQGLTPEAWLTYASLHLERTDRVLDDYQAKIPDPQDPNQTISIASWSYLTGAYFPVTGGVARAYWHRDTRQASLGRAGPGWSHDGGVRAAVRVP